MTLVHQFGISANYRCRLAQLLIIEEVAPELFSRRAKQITNVLKQHIDIEDPYSFYQSEIEKFTSGIK